MNTNAATIASLTASTNNTLTSQLSLINTTNASLSALTTSTNNTFTSHLSLINANGASISTINNTLAAQVALNSTVNGNFGN